MAILAGGQATRLRPLTQRIPKALLEVAGRPFVDHQLALLRRHGAGRVVICAGYLGQMIRDHLGDGRACGLDVAYSFDGDRLLGTGGALRKALPLLGPAFLVLYGDSYLPCDYRAAQQAFLAAGRLALMTVCRNEGQWDASNVEMADGEIRAYSKKDKTPRMRHIDYGLGLLQAEALAEIPADQPCDLADVYQRLLARGQLAALEIPERFYEIGSFQGLAELDRLLRQDAGPQLPAAVRRPRRAVFLDRDGVLLATTVEGGTPRPAAERAAARVLPGVAAALQRLKAQGFLTIVVSNQPDVARGAQTRQRVEEINAWMAQELPLDACYVCYHDNADHCDCRKPRPGLLLAAARDFDIDLAGSFMVGDRWRDIDAGAAAGCRTILIDYAYSERSPEHPPLVKLNNLSQAADWILRQAEEVVGGQGSVVSKVNLTTNH